MSSQPDKEQQLHAMRYSAAHILAAAVQRLWPDAKFGVGPVVEHGFYYDIDLGPSSKLSEEDFAKIEAEMQAIIKADEVFERFELPVDQALDWAKESKQPYKEELLNDLKRAGTTVAKDLSADELGTIAAGDAAVTNVSFYKNGAFTDLCRGPHVAATSKVGAFKLMRVSGAYWRGNEKNAQMQRVYGVAFATPKELKQHLALLEEAKRRDHRKLGAEMDLYVTSDLIGSGLPLFTPRGTVLRDELAGFAESLRKASDFERVSVPHIAKNDLYKTSGHWDKFGDELFLVESQETSDDFVLKPMNCPHHNEIYAARPRSYRDLPIKYFETTTVYRDEKSGELGGLSRVRSITQDDSHAYCRADQVGDVVAGLIRDVHTLYTTLGLSLRARLSFRDDSDGYLGALELWEDAQNTIRQLADASKLDYFEVAGEAAFYGPKIDFMATDALGREHQVATVQLDFVQPERFKLSYATEDGTSQQPIMVHCALLGSIERFLSVYIEHTAGKFPLWCAPEQLRLITVNQESDTVEFAAKVRQQARELGLRVVVDNDNESVGKKIRAAEVAKVPYSLVLGEREIAGGDVTPRVRGDLRDSQTPVTALPMDAFLQTLVIEAAQRQAQSSL